MTPDDPSPIARGLAAYAAGRFDDAEALFRKVLQAQPDDVDALQHLGLIALARRDIVAALGLLERVRALSPASAQVLCNYGNALAQSGQLQAAVVQFRQAIHLEPALPDSYCNLGLALTLLGATDEAVFVLRQAIALRPAFAEALVNLGGALQAQKRHAEALEAFSAALAVQPGHAGALTGTAQALAGQGRVTAAIAAYRQALAAAPDFSAAYVNLGCALLEAAEPSAAAEVFRAGLARDPGSAALRSNLLLALQYDPGSSAAEAVAESRAWQKYCVPPAPPRGPATRGPKRPAVLRIGFVSADFRAHPVGWFLRGVLPQLASGGYALHAYANQPGSDAVTRELASACKAWHVIHGAGDAEVAERIAADGIDVLVDLSGHTAGHRLGVFARRPALAQVSWLGYFATTGLDTMDAVLMDSAHVPPGAESQFTETVERLDPLRFCYSPPDYAPPVVPPPCLANGFVTFGGFQNAAKLNPEVLATWARVLVAVPGSRLVLRWASLGDRALQRRLLGPMAELGVAPGRILSYGAEPHDSMLEAYGEIDVALDPFPFSGATTTCEALWMGVPVVTWPGSRPVSRQSAAILGAIGCPELCASSAETYVALAANLAADTGRLPTLRASLRERMRASPLCDASGFAVRLGAAIERVWSRCASGSP